MSEADHWLWRLDRAAWAAAALVEWRAALDNVARRRTAVAHCRRAAGMALNGVLVAWAERTAEPREALESRWGRSYVDHLNAVASGDHGPLDANTVELAREIIATPMAATTLVGLGARPHAEMHALVETTRRLLDACAGV